MLIYVTRHGQPDLDQVSWTENPDVPLCDPILTEKGRIQAKYLGQSLKQKRFNGLIISSPYRRTLETSQIIAEQTNSVIIVESAIQEVITESGIPDFKILNIEQIKQLYNNVSQDCTMPYPWLSRGPEALEEVKKRIAPFLKQLFKSNPPDAEVLLVGHGASVHACKELLLKSNFDKNIPEKHNWNCSISSYILNSSGNMEKYELFNIEHMPENIITSNRRLYSMELQYGS